MLVGKELRGRVLKALDSTSDNTAWSTRLVSFHPFAQNDVKAVVMNVKRGNLDFMPL